MQEQLISFETAKLAKEKGLKLNFCRELFYPDINNEGEFITINCIHDWTLIEKKEWYSRPTQSLLQKWLRETYNIEVIPYRVVRADSKKEYGVRIDDFNRIGEKGMPFHTHHEGEDSFEGAFEVGLQKGLKIVKTNALPEL